MISSRDRNFPGVDDEDWEGKSANNRSEKEISEGCKSFKVLALQGQVITAAVWNQVVFLVDILTI